MGRQGYYKITIDLCHRSQTFGCTLLSNELSFYLTLVAELFSIYPTPSDEECYFHSSLLGMKVGLGIFGLSECDGLGFSLPCEF